MTKEQFEKIRKAKKQTNDLAKKNNVEVGTGKYGSLNNKLSKSIEDKNLSEANKIMKDMKDFIKDVKDKPVVKKAGRKQKYATYQEARQAAIDAGKKTFGFGGRKNIPVERKKSIKQDISDLKEKAGFKDMSPKEKKAFSNKRDNEIEKLKKQQLNDIMSDKYGGKGAYGGVRVQKLTPEGEKLLNEGKINQIVNAQKFIKLTKKVKKNGKIVTKQILVPTNKYVVEGIDAPLIPKGAKPIGKEEKRKMNQYFQNEMTDSQRLDYIMDRYEPQYTSSQLADILGITSRNLTSTLKKSGKYKQIVGDEGSIPKEGFQTRMITKGMKTGGIVKAKKGTGKKTIGSYKAGTKKSTIGKARDYVKKSPIKSAMGALGAYEVYDVGKYAMDTLGPILGFKSGTKGKTIRGCGKAMRGFGKAMTGRKK
jgi:hypothetical protein